MKKNLFIIFLILISFNLISCERNTLPLNKEENTSNSESEVVEAPEKKVYTEFKALGNIYTSSKNINDLEPGDVVYDLYENLYVKGEYKEVDFGFDVVTSYLNENEKIFENLVSFNNSSEDKFIKITEEDKIKLLLDLETLRSQMEMFPSEEMIVQLDQVTYLGISDETESGVTLKIRVAISRSTDYLAAWNYFTVTVYEKEDILYANLF